MNDHEIQAMPAVINAIRSDTQKLGFTMGFDMQTGALLRAPVSSKPKGRFLANYFKSGG